MKCKYPSCKANSEKQWATVDLCESHYTMIKEETVQYYTGKGHHHLTYEERIHYISILQYIPFASKG